MRGFRPYGAAVQTAVYERLACWGHRVAATHSPHNAERVNCGAP
jgi:hypothetical protein